MRDEIRMDRKTFESLASETRIAILKTLDARQMTVTELANALSLAKSTVHEHLSKMLDAGLVEKLQDNRKWSYYKLTYKAKRILHPHEMVKIMVLLSLAFLAFVGGVMEITSYKPAQWEIGMATYAPGETAPGYGAAERKAAEPAPEPAPEPQEELEEPASEPAPPTTPREPRGEPGYPSLLGVLLLLLSIALGLVALKRWRALNA